MKAPSSPSIPTPGKLCLQQWEKTSHTGSRGHVRGRQLRVLVKSRGLLGAHLPGGPEGQSAQRCPREMEHEVILHFLITIVLKR